MTYKGWTNEETYWTSVKVSNTVDCYNLCKGKTGSEIKKIVESIHRMKYNSVNWDEIAESLKEEGQQT